MLIEITSQAQIDDYGKAGMTFYVPVVTPAISNMTFEYLAEDFEVKRKVVKDMLRMAKAEGWRLEASVLGDNVFLSFESDMEDGDDVIGTLEVVGGGCG